VQRSIRRCWRPESGSRRWHCDENSPEGCREIARHRLRDKIHPADTALVASISGGRSLQRGTFGVDPTPTCRNAAGARTTSTGCWSASCGADLVELRSKSPLTTGRRRRRLAVRRDRVRTGAPAGAQAGPGGVGRGADRHRPARAGDVGLATIRSDRDLRWVPANPDRDARFVRPGRHRITGGGLPGAGRRWSGTSLRVLAGHALECQETRPARFPATPAIRCHAIQRGGRSWSHSANPAIPVSDPIRQTPVHPAADQAMSAAAEPNAPPAK
jgi:hypothetical protein